MQSIENVPRWAWFRCSVGEDMVDSGWKRGGEMGGEMGWVEDKQPPPSGISSEGGSRGPYFRRKKEGVALLVTLKQACR